MSYSVMYPIFYKGKVYPNYGRVKRDVIRYSRYERDGAGGTCITSESFLYCPKCDSEECYMEKGTNKIKCFDCNNVWEFKETL